MILVSRAGKLPAVNEEETSKWIYQNLRGRFDTFTPEVLGPGRTLFENSTTVPLVSYFLDPPAPPETGWGRLPGCSSADSFFLRLVPFMERHASFSFNFIRGPRQVLLIRRLSKFDGRGWRQDALGDLGEFHRCFLLGERTALLHFHARPGYLGIFFHGAEGLWLEIHEALYEENPAAHHSFQS